MKKTLSLLLVVLLLGVYGVFALGSSDSEGGSTNQGSETVQKQEEEANLGDYKVEIVSSRLAKTYDDKGAIIVKYKFTNNSDEPTAFYIAFEAEAYQDGVGLNEAFMLKDSANYSADNQTKDIKKGASIEVEVAYELNDDTTNVEVEVKELFSFSDKTITKTFAIK